MATPQTTGPSTAQATTQKPAQSGARISRRALLGAAGVAALAACEKATPGHATAGEALGPTGTPTTGTAPSISSSGTAPGTTSYPSSPLPSHAPTTPPSTRLTSTPTPTTGSIPPGPADLDALAAGIDGTLIRPNDDQYRRASELFNPRFDDIQPQAIARCTSPDDVAECVLLARRSGMGVAMRSGGHCYEGWSTGPGLVIDTGPMSAIRTDDGQATIGAGAHLIDVYHGLAADGVGIPAGSCPTVGITGLTLGGGIGVVDRHWGLTCDTLTAAEIVTADGSIVHCDSKHDADLFWACRGGAGGTFGVATALTFRTRPTADVATWGLSWPWSRAAAVIDAWLRWVPDAPDKLWGSVHLSSAPNSATPYLSVVGTYFGADAVELQRVLDTFISAVGAHPSSQYANQHSFMDAMMVDAGCSGKSFESCHLEPAGTVGRQAYAASSDWITTPMNSSGIGTLLSGIKKRHDTPGVPAVAVQLDAAGGAINRVSPGATAFVHRNAICSVQYIANWYPSTSTKAVKSAAAWPHRMRQHMQPYVSGGAYQNYVDGKIKHWQRAYFGANYPRLQRTKAHYDPTNLFHHPQSVRAS